MQHDHTPQDLGCGLRQRNSTRRHDFSLLKAGQRRKDCCEAGRANGSARKKVPTKHDRPVTRVEELIRFLFYFAYYYLPHFAHPKTLSAPVARQRVELIVCSRKKKSRHCIRDYYYSIHRWSERDCARLFNPVQWYFYFTVEFRFTTKCTLKKPV